MLELLLRDERYDTVVSIGRRELAASHEKLIQLQGDLFDMDTFADAFQDADDLFVAIGTTRAKTPDKKQYESIDCGIPVAAGKLAAEREIGNVVVVSSMGANPRSRIPYAALKGRMEEALQRLPIENLNLVRPGVLLGKRDEHRTGERLGKFLMTRLDFLIPGKHKPIPAAAVAKAMLVLANRPFEKHTWTNEELHTLSE